MLINLSFAAHSEEICFFVNGNKIYNLIVHCNFSGPLVFIFSITNMYDY